MRDSFASTQISIQRICEHFGISRQAYYQRQRRNKQQISREQVVLALVQQCRTELPKEGGKKLYRRIRPELERRGIKVGRDKLYGLLRTNGLLVRRRRKYVTTTQSKHRFKIYKNMIADYIPTKPNQLWVSDITYLRVGGSFMYLALITDAYSRKIVGYDFSNSLELSGCLRALSQALKQRGKKHQLIHHSDRGIQYCSKAYVEQLEKHGVCISMASAGNCYENALAERVNGILKQEFLLDQHFTNQSQAKRAVRQAIEKYNRVRLHMSIGYLTPTQKHAA